MKTLTWQKPGQQNVAQELIKIIINYVAELRINYLINHYSKEYTQMIVGTGDVPGVLAFYKSCGFEYSHCIKGFFTENYDHPIIDNGILLKDMIYLKRKIGFLKEWKKIKY